MKNRLRTNCAARGGEEVRAACVEKCRQLPFPAANPRPMNASRIATFAAVSAFCTRATRCTPNMFSTGKISTSPQANALVDGQGNFGSIDDDPPAAMRYTEV